MKLNVWKVAMLGVMAALAIVLVFFVRFPLLPAVPFMEYEPADVIIVMSSFLFGPIEALLLTIIVSVVQGTTVSAGSGWVGIIMHIISSGTFAVTTGLVYRWMHTKKGAVIALIAGIICTTAIMIPANLFFTVRFWGFPRDMVVDLLLPGIIPFNLLKTTINGVLVFLIYKPVSRAFELIHAKPR